MFKIDYMSDQWIPGRKEHHQIFGLVSWNPMRQILLVLIILLLTILAPQARGEDKMFEEELESLEVTPELVVFIATAAVVWFILATWTYYDARNRGLNAKLWFILVLIFNIFGLVGYLTYTARKPVPYEDPWASIPTAVPVEHKRREFGKSRKMIDEKPLPSNSAREKEVPERNGEEKPDPKGSDEEGGETEKNMDKEQDPRGIEVREEEKKRDMKEEQELKESEERETKGDMKEEQEQKESGEETKGDMKEEKKRKGN